jgi:outer membrane protein insertion porin family
MFAKQTIASASLVLAFEGAALADPDPSPSSSAGATGGFQVGVGYGTQTGFMAMARIEQRNLFGTGDDLALAAEISALHSLYDLHFAAPYFLDTDWTLTADLYSDRRQLPGFTRDAVGGSVSMSREIAPHLRVLVGWRLEHVAGEQGGTTAVDAGDPVPLKPPLSAGLVSAARAGISYDSRDSLLFPTRGSDAGVSLEYADPRLGSSIQLATVQAWAGTNQALGPLRLHVDGSLTAVSSPSLIPMSERLYLAGTDVRGFQLGAFGPLDGDGNPIGGTLKLIGRASLEAPLGSTISFENFVDAARIDDTSVTGALGLSHAWGASAGFGVIWRSPIGPLRVDVAFPLTAGIKPVLVFSIGGAF